MQRTERKKAKKYTELLKKGNISMDFRMWEQMKTLNGRGAAETGYSHSGSRFQNIARGENRRNVRKNIYSKKIRPSED